MYKNKLKKLNNNLLVRLNSDIYIEYQKRIRCFNTYNIKKIKENKNYFCWVFHILKISQYLIPKMQDRRRRKEFVRYERRVAPGLNLRLYSLYAGIMKHGNSMRAKNVLSKIIILLTENFKERSGCTMLNNVLRFLEPSIGLLIYRRGRNFYQMPIPLWPNRKKFLAAKFLIKGAKRRQQLYRMSFFLSLYYEIIDVHLRKKDCFTLKILQKYRKKLSKVEIHAWRNKKKKF